MDQHLPLPSTWDWKGSAQEGMWRLLTLPTPGTSTPLMGRGTSILFTEPYLPHSSFTSSTMSAMGTEKVVQLTQLNLKYFAQRLMLTGDRCFNNGVRCCTNSRQVAREPPEPLPRRKCAPDIPAVTSSMALLTSFDLLKGNFRPKRVGNVAQRHRRIRIVDSTAASGRALG